MMSATGVQYTHMATVTLFSCIIGSVFYVRACFVDVLEMHIREVIELC